MTTKVINHKRYHSYQRVSTKVSAQKIAKDFKERNTKFKTTSKGYKRVQSVSTRIVKEGGIYVVYYRDV